MAATQKSPSLWSQLAHLVPILLALVFGSLVGVYFGQSMWLASEAPAKQKEMLERSQQTLTTALESASEERRAKLETQLSGLAKELERTNKLLVDKAENPPSGWYRFSFKMLDFAGDLFLQMLKLLVLPLVITSMIAGIGGLGDIRGLGRMGRVTMLYFVITTACAVVIGLILVQVIRPGVNSEGSIEYANERLEARKSVDALDTVLHLVIGGEDDVGGGMFPSNLFQAAYSMNVLGLIVFSLVLGAALTTLGNRGQLVIDFFNILNEGILQVVRWVMYFAPIGIFGLVAANIASKGGGDQFFEQLSRLGWYAGTVGLGLGGQSLLLLIILLAVGRNPITYLLGVSRALLTAFSTASSSASLPISMECVEDNNGISKQSANFVLPLGATINMNGTALYEAVAAVFIAQQAGIPLDLGQLVVVFVTATLAAVGAAGIPEAGLVTMVMVLTAVGLPTSGIGAILAIDWFLDRLRTTVNVFSDTIGAAVTDRLVPDTHRGTLGGSTKKSDQPS